MESDNILMYACFQSRIRPKGGNSKLYLHLLDERKSADAVILVTSI